MTDTVVLPSEDDRAEKCRWCYYWKPPTMLARTHSGAWYRGDCRRHAPTRGSNSQPNWREWLTTEADDWCGDFRRVVVEGTVKEDRDAVPARGDQHAT